jgi:hypothetical protein
MRQFSSKVNPSNLPIIATTTAMEVVAEIAIANANNMYNAIILFDPLSKRTILSMSNSFCL